MSTLLSIGGLKSTVILDATQFATGMAHVVQLAQQTSQQVTAANTAMATSFNAITQGAANVARQQATVTQAARQRAAADAQLASLEQRVAAAQTDAAGRVRLYTQAMDQATAGSKEYLQAQLKMLSAQKEVTREQLNSAQAVAGGVGRGVLQGAGFGGILGGLGIAGGVAIATRSLIDLGKASTDLAVRAQTIGTAYQAATQRAGLGADDLLKRLNAAARGTVSATDLMASSNKALALGVGQNAQQIADLLAIARQKGKDFGEGTAQAFEDITTGLGRLSPRILDNLGIILDENKIYQEYARSIGVVEGKLSDQEKRQALVNELLRTNSDLIKKNADANLDAADKIARSQATIEQAKTRVGAALLPGVASIAEQGATFVESFTGSISARADALNRQLAAQATSAEDYVKRYNAAIKQLNPSGETRAGTTDELMGQYLALNKLSDAEAFELRNLAQSDQGRSEAIQGYRASTQAIIESTQATQLNKDQLDALGASLAIATDRGLRPYKAAVDQARTALDGHKASTQAVKDQVNELTDALSKAQKRYDDFGHAQLVGTKAYEDQKFAISQAKAQVDLDLLNFKAPGAGLDRVLQPIKAQIDATDASLKGYKSDLDEINSFVEDQTRVVQEATDAQKQYDDAVGAAKDNLDQQQSRLDALQGHYDDLTTAINAAKRAQDELRRTPLVGEGALSDKLFNMDQAITRQGVAIDQAKLRNAGKDEMKRLQAELDRLETLRDIAEKQGSLKYDKEHRIIDQANTDRQGQEKTVQQVTDAIAAQQAAIDKGTAAQQQMKTVIDGATATVDQAKQSLMEATTVQRWHKEEVDADKAALERLKVAQSAISKQYDEQKQKLSDLKTQLDTTRNDALKPFQDAIDDLDRRASRVDLNKQLKLDPLARQLQDAFKPIHELTFQEAIDGMRTTGQQINDLQTKLGSAQKVLASEEAATKEAQAHYDAAEKALTEQQKYFDNLKQGLDDLKTNLQGSKDIWGDLSTLIAAINQANTSVPIPGMKAPFTGQTPGGTGAGPAYDVNAINNVLARAHSPLTGQGQFIIEMSQKYGIPVEVALAMWKVEGNYGTLGASVANKNPGNLRKSNFAAGTTSDNFAIFDSWKAGIEGFFDLLRHNTYGYDRDVDKYKETGDTKSLLHLISTYAPASDNNNPKEYYDSVADMIKQLLQAIMAQGTASTAASAAGTSALEQALAKMGLGGSSITGNFNDDRSYRDADGVMRHHRHGGLDIAGLTEGTPVDALEGGIVRKAYFDPNFGNLVEIENAVTHQLTEYYGHLKDLNVHQGQLIAAGDQIGTLGHTGALAEGTHLHFQMWDELGNLVDPLVQLAKLFGSGAGPGDADVQALMAYLTLTRDLSGAYTGAGDAAKDLAPNLPDLAAGMTAVGDAATAAAAATADASTAIVNATDEILNHAAFKLKGGLDGHAGYDGATGGMPGYKGAPDPFTYGAAGGRSHNDPSWGDKITQAADAATSATKTVQEVVPLWQTSWKTLGDTTILALDRADQFAFGATENIQGYIDSAIDRINELIAKIMEIPGIHTKTDGMSFGTGAIRMLASGGPVSAGETVMVGDGGEPEYFTAGASGFITPQSKAGGDTHNHWAIDLRGSTLTEREVKRAIEDALRERDRRFGERRRGL